jgi:hypothetical protein
MLIRFLMDLSKIKVTVPKPRTAEVSSKDSQKTGWPLQNLLRSTESENMGKGRAEVD